MFAFQLTAASRVARRVSSRGLSGVVPSCCPGALPVLPMDDSSYIPQGETINLGGSDCYRVGENWGTAIVVMHDVFGPNSGGHKQVCDKLASGGHYVIMPDFYEGGSIEPYYNALKVPEGKAWLKQYGWGHCGPIMDAVYEHLYGDLQVKKCGSIGFCWGAWAVARVCSDPSRMHAGVWAHPSCQVGHELYGEGDEKWLSSEVKSPTMILPTPQEPAMYRDGSLEKIMNAHGVETDKVEFVAPVTHGFFVRAAGFLGKSWTECGGQFDRDEFVAAQRGINLSLGWFGRHLY